MNALVWLTWRQHRWSVIGVTMVAVFATYALITSLHGQAGGLMMAGFYGLMVQIAFGAVIGVFWGAPLIARELEERTYFVAWGQDVTPVKWLRGKVLLLGGLAVVLGLLLGIGNGIGGARLTWGAFEFNPLVQAGYAFFGFALGVFIGLLSRHVVTAMAATLVFYTAVRALISVAVRDYYLPPQRAVARWDTTPVLPGGALELGGGFVGPDLEPVPLVEKCTELVNANSCMRTAKAAVGTYTDYQPVGVVWLFQVIEFLVFALLAAGLLFLTFRMLRRGGGWKPSRRHRRIGPEPVDAESVDAKPVDAEPADAKPVDAKSLDAEPADAKPADAEPVDAEPADAEPVDAEPADAKPADAKPGQSTPAAAAAQAEG